MTTDHMVLAVGVEPDMELARSSNLEIDPLHGGFKVLELYSGHWALNNIHNTICTDYTLYTCLLYIISFLTMEYYN